MEGEGSSSPFKVPKRPSAASTPRPEPKPSTSKALSDAEIFKRPLAPAPKRKKYIPDAVREPSSPPVAGTSAKAKSMPPPPPPPPKPKPKNVRPPINLLADIEQARAVSEWENSYRGRNGNIYDDARKTVASLTAADILEGERMADNIAREIVARRTFGAAYVHLCVESMIASVEIRDNPQLKIYPIGVCSRKTLCSVNGLAIDQGVQPGMPISLGLTLCPNMKIIPANFNKYNQITLDIKAIARSYDSEAIVSMNYVDMQLTDCLLANKQRLEKITKSETAKKEILVEEIRRKIFDKTGLKVYAGVGPTPLIAKLASLLRRPFGIYIVAPNKHAIDSFLRGLPVTQFCGINGKIEGMLKKLNIQTSDQIWKRRGTLPYLVNHRTLEQLMCICLGCTPDFVKMGIISNIDGYDTVTYSKWLYGTRLMKFLEEVCHEVCLKLEERMKTVKVIGKLVIVRLSAKKSEQKKRVQALPLATNDAKVIMQSALQLIELFLSEEPKFLINGVRIDICELAPMPVPKSLASSAEGKANGGRIELLGNQPRAGPSQEVPLSLHANLSAAKVSHPAPAVAPMKTPQASPAGDRARVNKGKRKNKSSTTIKSKKSKRRYILKCPNCSRRRRSKGLRRSERKMNAHVNRCLLRTVPGLY